MNQDALKLMEEIGKTHLAAGLRYDGVFWTCTAQTSQHDRLSQHDTDALSAISKVHAMAMKEVGK